MQKFYLPGCLCVLFVLFELTGFSQASITSKKLAAGFKVISAVDSSRIFKPGTANSDYLHFRPVDLDIWYPSQPSSNDTTLCFKDFLGMLEQRANYYTASRIADGITTQIAQSFVDNLKCSDTTRILRFKTDSYRDAVPAKGKFPLVVYLCSYNGMAFENVRLFEELAKKGFVVVSISSIGRYPGDMTMKNEDMMEQVKDAQFAINLFSANNSIDRSKIGIVGYSWGGLSGVVLANRIRNTACVVSLEGSEFHHYGSVKKEDEDFDGIANSNEFERMHLSIPYLRLESQPVANNKKDSIFNFSRKLSNEQVLTVDSASHQDFSQLVALVSASGNCEYRPVYNTVLKITTSFLEHHLQNRSSFSETLQNEVNRTVRKRK